jgi:hypothetical protein
VTLLIKVLNQFLLQGGTQTVIAVDLGVRVQGPRLGL